MDRVSNLFLLIAVLCHPYVESYGFYKHDSFERDEHFGPESHESIDGYKAKHFGPDRHYLPSKEESSSTSSEYSDYSEYDDHITDKNIYDKKFDHPGFPHFGSTFDHKPSANKYEHPMNNFDHHGSNKFEHHAPNNFDYHGHHFDHHGPNEYGQHGPDCHQNGPNYHHPTHFDHQGSENHFGNQGQMNQGQEKNPVNQFGQQNPGLGRPRVPPIQFGQTSNQNRQTATTTTTTQRPSNNYWTNLFPSSITTPRPTQPTASPRGTTPSPLAVLTCIRSCPVTSEYNPVCGSNNVTFNNLGRLECAINCGAAVTLQRSSSCSVAPNQSPHIPNFDTTSPTTPAFQTMPTRYTTIDFTSQRPGQTNDFTSSRPDHTNSPLNPGTVAPDVLSSIFHTKPTTGTEEYDGDIDIRFEN